MQRPGQAHVTYAPRRPLTSSPKTGVGRHDLTDKPDWATPSEPPDPVFWVRKESSERPSGRWATLLFTQSDLRPPHCCHPPRAHPFIQPDNPGKGRKWGLKTPGSRSVEAPADVLRTLQNVCTQSLSLTPQGSETVPTWTGRDKTWPLEGNPEGKVL